MFISECSGLQSFQLKLYNKLLTNKQRQLFLESHTALLNLSIARGGPGPGARRARDMSTRERAPARWPVAARTRKRTHKHTNANSELVLAGKV